MTAVRDAMATALAAAEAHSAHNCDHAGVVPDIYVLA